MINFIKYKYQQLKDIVSKYKDYDRLAYDYACVLNHATRNRMSKTNYDTTVIYTVIDEVQSEFYYSIIYDDVNDIINTSIVNRDKILEIQKYLKNNLN